MINLNEDQQNAITQILKFIKTKESDFMCFLGCAGSGKSTTIQHLFEHLPAGTKVCFTATTNKAVKVLRTMAAKKNLNVECITIHSLLGLSMQFKDGKETLKSGGKSQFEKFDLVVIDESSMINTELLGYIHRAVNRSGNTQVLFIGDSNQLPPVGEKMSPVFAINNKVVLTKVVRQAQGNPILNLCTAIRTEIDNGTFNVPQIIPATNEAGNIGVHIMSGEAFEQWMPSAFSHENFNDNYDKFRVVAWRNATVDRFNNIIQKLRYPDLTMPFAIGEPVTFSKPLHQVSTKADFVSDTPLQQGWDAILCSTESEGVIENVVKIEPFELKPSDEQVAKGFNFRPFVIDRYVVTVKLLDDDELVSCVIAGNKAQLKAMLDFVSNNARNGSGNFVWFDFYRLQKYFADLRPGYCLTVHKSQGSTYNNVFIDVNDIVSNPDHEETLRCLYVAVSRASENVVINV
jgi:exodeoxyribonuclease-5